MKSLEQIAEYASGMYDHLTMQNQQDLYDDPHAGVFMLAHAENAERDLAQCNDADDDFFTPLANYGISSLKRAYNEWLACSTFHLVRVA